MSARRRCGPRAPMEWRARCVAAVGCATLTKVKVIGAGAGRGISPTFAAVIHSSTHAPRQGRFPPLLRDSDLMLPSAFICTAQLCNAVTRRGTVTAMSKVHLLYYCRVYYTQNHAYIDIRICS